MIITVDSKSICEILYSRERNPIQIKQSTDNHPNKLGDDKKSKNCMHMLSKARRHRLFLDAYQFLVAFFGLFFFFGLSIHKQTNRSCANIARKRFTFKSTLVTISLAACMVFTQNPLRMTWKTTQMHRWRHRRGNAATCANHVNNKSNTQHQHNTMFNRLYSLTAHRKRIMCNRQTDTLVQKSIKRQGRIKSICMHACMFVCSERVSTVDAAWVPAKFKCNCRNVRTSLGLSRTANWFIFVVIVRSLALSQVRTARSIRLVTVVRTYAFDSDQHRLCFKCSLCCRLATGKFGL